ncbi:PA14 domain-containing protein [Flagellimonas algicola]|uniref:Glycosyl hydrolase n=1 Tax=Flagellimonas algicola TaxID=2583815 RepID=A0ABY2WNH2_9FLAO|nr:PA14 domain-containing protein [Allomuricauda algicola]TMU56533.1 glycosyl hydrolase [Allomuricauda algicola]
MTFRNKSTALFSLILPVLLLISSCSTKPDPHKRPMETWVFRSVLDKKPRMVTAALHNNMWLAYDTQDGTLYKAWKGGVNFDGAVYTTKHGPQPTSLGYAYLSNKEQWTLTKDGKQTEAQVQYKGHKFTNGGVSFNYVLMTPDSEIIEVVETPTYIAEGDKNGLQRSFEISNPTDYQVVLETVVSSLQNENDYSTTGSFTDTSKEEIQFEDGEILQIKGSLVFNEPKTIFSAYFHPGFDKLEQNNNELALEENTKKMSLGARLIEGSDCKACHNEEVKTIGPSYMAIAEKYPMNDATIKNLSEKIKLGGNGVWGEAMMTAHPDLPDADVEEMVKYILALDTDSDEEEDELPAEFTLDTESIPLDFKEKVKPKSGNGLVAHLFLAGDEDIETNAASNKTTTSNVHILKTDDFGGINANFKLVLKGQITIPQTGSYDFRLMSDDGSYLFLDEELAIDNGGFHAVEAVDGEMYLKKGAHEIRIEFEQGGGDAGLSFQWFNKANEQFELLPNEILTYTEAHFSDTTPYEAPMSADEKDKELRKPGDKKPLEDVHPSFTLFQARPDDFKPRVGGMDFKSDSTLILSTWDAEGSVYVIKNYLSGNPGEIVVKRIASGLAEPLGVKVVDDEIYVLQKQELTKLIDHDGDEIIDEYQVVSNKWKVSDNFHEFAFGLEYNDGHFYATLATAILPGGASASPQIPDRGKTIKVNKESGDLEFIAHGLRTPNGIGFNKDKELFVADNQGDWLPSSKIVHIQNGEFYGSRSVDPEGTANLDEKLPVVWLPQDEIGNSPSEPSYLDVGPYKSQLIHGEVTHGGIKRVAYEKVEGQLQGAVFRFTQGIEAGVNRIRWAPDGSLVIGGIGVSGNWLHYGKLNYGLQRMKYNGNTTFEMLKITSKSNGFAIEFTEPLAGDTDPANLLEVEQWYYLPTEAYGGPKLDHKMLRSSVNGISDDRKTVYVSVQGLKENHVVYFHLNPNLRSSSDQDIWSTEAWYTLNKISKDDLSD